MPSSSRARPRAGRLLLLVLGALLALLGFAGPANAAATPAQKVPLTQTNRNCDGVPADRQDRSFGFAIVHLTGSNKLVASVVLKHATPNTTYNIRLIQVVSGDADCSVIGGTLTTDAQGDGNANVQERALRGARSVWVDLNNQNNFAAFFTTQVVNFS